MIALVLALLVAEAAPTAKQCAKAAAEIDEMLGDGRRDDAWTAADRIGPECGRIMTPSTPLPRHLAAANAAYRSATDHDARAKAAERVVVSTMTLFGPRHEYTAEWLGKLGYELEAAGRPDQALQLYERSLDIREEVHGKDAEPIAWSLSAVAGAYADLGRYDEAIALYHRALDIELATVGEIHEDTATTVSNLGGVYDSTGDYANARACYERALKIREQALGPDHEDTATSLDTLGSLLVELGDVDAGRSLIERGLAVREKGLGGDHYLVATSLVSLGQAHLAVGDPRAATKLYERALRIRTKAFGPDAPATLTTYDELATAWQAAGEPRKALEARRKALALREAAFGPNDAAVGKSLNTLGILLVEMGRYAEALATLDRALAVTEASYGADHPRVASVLNNLAILHAALGDYDRALALYERALLLNEAALGPDSPHVANALDNLAELHLRRGNFDVAKPMIERGLAIREAVYGPEHPDVASSLNTLSGLHHALGDFAHALPLLERALAIREAALGADHAVTAITVHNLAVLLSDMGELDRAVELGERAVTSAEKALGPDHPDVAGALASLGAHYREAGRPKEAVERFERALEIREAAFGPDNPETALGRYDLAQGYLITGRAADALPLAIAAAELQERVLGDAHPETARSLHLVGSVHRALGNDLAALPFTARAVEVEERYLARNLGFASGAQQRAMLDPVRFTTQQALSLALGDLPADAAAAEMALTTVLRRKARGLDAEADVMAQVRRALGDDGDALLDQLRDALSERDAVVRAGPGESATAWEAAIAEQDARVDELQRDLAARSATFRAATTPVTIDAVRTALPPKSALVEIVIWFPYDPTAPINGWGVPRYAAYVLKPDGTVSWADLGEGLAMDAAVDKLRKALVDGGAWEKPAAALHAKLVAPLAAHLDGVERVYVAPDGALHLVPMGVLVDANGRRLDEGREVVVLASGRELTRKAAMAAPSTKPAVVVAGVDYGAKGTWAELPGAAEEGGLVAAALGATTLTRGAATEAAVSALTAPRVLHVATHGFFDRSTPEATQHDAATRGVRVQMAADLVVPEEPGPSWADEDESTALWRSGLVLAGANGGASSAGEAVAAAGSGYLTAAEVAAMDLRGTQLVVLSACETGLGAAKEGQGLMGLRHALVVAGSRAQVLSLWKVDDAATKALMITFYRELGAGRTAAQALSTAQREVAADPRWAHPRFWAAFTLSGDPDAKL